MEFCNDETPRYSSGVPAGSRVIASDDVFDYLLDVRCINEKVDVRREDLLEDYKEARYASFQMRSLEDYEQLKRHNDAKRLSGSRYVKQSVMGNLPEKSNGESAFLYFTENIKENALYLLDEPENSLSAGRQQELQRFLADSARHFGCQFIIATHSPFLLSMKGARIYDLDGQPAGVRQWTELENVRAYFEFFQEHKEEFCIRTGGKEIK